IQAPDCRGTVSEPPYPYDLPRPPSPSYARSRRPAPIHTRRPPPLSPVSVRLAVTFLRVLWRGYRRNLELVLRYNPLLLSSFLRLSFCLYTSPRLYNRLIFLRQFYAAISEALAISRHLRPAASC